MARESDRHTGERALGMAHKSTKPVIQNLHNFFIFFFKYLAMLGITIAKAYQVLPN